MDFEFSDEQEQLRAAARAMLSDYCSSERIRLAIGSSIPFDRDLWAQMVDLEWFALGSPPGDDSGGGFVEACILLEEIGRALAPVPYLPTLLALWALDRAGEPELVHPRISFLNVVNWSTSLTPGGRQCGAWSRSR